MLSGHFKQSIMKIIKRNFAKINLSEKVSAIIEKDKLFNCQNYTSLPFVITHAKGAYMYDINGNKYLDCIGAYSAVSQGHLHPRIKKAIIDQMEKVSLTGRGLYNDKLADATEYLTKTFGYDKAIMMNTGVEGGETAIKFARRWGYQVKKIPHDQAWVLFAANNFWGRTIAACGSSDDPSRYHNFGPFGLNFKILEYDNADAFEEELKRNPNVAAIMLEPIQGEAGVIIPSDSFIRRVRDMCNKYNVLLIFDEVQTGLGRTGKMLCQEHWQVKADLVILGKALSGGFMPISAVLGSDEVFNCMGPNSHGSTFGGNPLACATMKESVQVIIDEGMAENSYKQGEYLINKLRPYESEFPFFSKIRGKGLFFAFDICQKTGPEMKQFIYSLAQKGILAKNTRNDIIRFAPPLIITKHEADKIVDAVISTLREHLI